MVKRTIFFIQILLLLMAGSAFGLYDDDNLPPAPGMLFWWSNGVGNRRWELVGNWWDKPGRIPGPYDVPSIDNPCVTHCTIFPDVDANCLELHVGDYPSNSGDDPELAELNVEGGTMTTFEDMLIGLRDNNIDSDYAIGDVNVVSGTVTVGRDLFIGREGQGTLHMRGGTFNVTGTIWCPGGPMPTYSGQTYTKGKPIGRMNLYGGTLSAADIDIWSEDRTEMNVEGGTLILGGDRTVKLKGYMQVDKLFAYGGRGEVIMDFNGTETTVTADVNYVLAWGPRPRNYSIDVEPDENLIWGPGDGAVKHDVYFGTVYSEVNEADDPNILPGRGRQDSNSYDPTLASDTTYYWRIDEVNGLTVHKGRIWEFKTRNVFLAYNPYPADGQRDVQLPLTLDWTEGLGADNHDVYFGTDFDDVTDANTSVPLGVYKGNVSGSSYPLSGLTFDTECYWRIDENDVGVALTKGRVWSFTLSNYLEIDWFETYGTGNPLSNTWSGTRATLTIVNPLDAGKDPVVESNAMKITYTPGASPTNYSEAVMTVPAGKRDWTLGGTKVLELKFHGIDLPFPNKAQKFYVEVSSAGPVTEMVVFPDPNLMRQGRQELWVLWPINLDVFSDAGVNLSDVTQLTIGIGDKGGSTTGTSGTVWIEDISLRGSIRYDHDGDADLDNDGAVDIDDIKLVVDDWLKEGYPEVNAPISDSDPNLILWYKFDDKDSGKPTSDTCVDSSGNGYNGQTLNIEWQPQGNCVDGNCIKFSYYIEYLTSIRVPDAAGPNNLGGHSTVSLWIRDKGVNDRVSNNIGSQLFQAGRGPQAGSLQVSCGYSGYFQYTCGYNTDEKDQDTVAWDNKLGFGTGYSNADHILGQWTHYAFVKDATEGEGDTKGVMRIYQNGKIVAELSGASGLLMPKVDRTATGDDKSWFTIGAFRFYGDPSSGSYYVGWMDDFRLYDRPLSQGEIMTLAGVNALYQPVVSSAEVTGDDDTVNFKDYAVVAAEWLEDPLRWPY